MRNFTYTQLKTLLENPNVDAKAQLELPEMIRYVYYRFPNLEQHTKEVGMVKAASVFRSTVFAVVAVASYYEGALRNCLPIFTFLAIYEYAYTSQRLEAVRTGFAVSRMEYDLRKRLVLSRLFPREYAAESNQPW